MLNYSEFNTDAEKTIIFLHGAGIGGWMWKPNIDHLPDYHCISVDLPGHGDSNELEWLSFEETAKGVANLITEKGKKGVAHVVGLSLGGYIALSLLKVAPQVVERTAISGIQIGKMPHAWLIQLLGYLIAPFLHISSFIRMNAKSLKIPDEYIDEYIEGAKKTSKQSYLAITKEAVNFEFSLENFPEDKDVLFLAGANEHKLVLSSLGYFQHFSKVVSFIVEGVGHAWSIEDQKLFSDTIKAWLNVEKLPDQLHREAI